MILLSTAYLGNIQYFSKILSNDKCVIEQHESYVKQSYRNRCEILSANGVITLTIPIVKQSSQQRLIKDSMIEYVMSWQKQHWKSIESAYRNSPYFEYFEDIFAPIYQHKERFLIDFNMKLMQSVLMCMEVDNADYVLSECYMMTENSDTKDFRNRISPKGTLQREDDSFEINPYYQVFSDKMPFVPNLSIIDLLFCEGLNAKNLIIKK